MTEELRTKPTYEDLEREVKELRYVLKCVLPDLKLVSEAIIPHDERLCTPQMHRYAMAKIALRDGSGV